MHGYEEKANGKESEERDKEVAYPTHKHTQLILHTYFINIWVVAQYYSDRNFPP